MPYADPSPRLLAPLVAAPGLSQVPPPHVGQQAVMNKRPIRLWGAADEWTFRFQAWHRLGFPGLQGRAGRSRLPERGHG